MQYQLSVLLRLQGGPKINRLAPNNIN